MDLQSLFNSFCAFGAGSNAKPEMDSAKFAKFCRDTKLFDKKFTSTDADLIFTKAKAKGERKITFDAFSSSCIPAIAAKKGVSKEDLEGFVLGSSGPTSTGTKASKVALHDDRSQYTGVYAKGGPTNVDNATSDLSHITNRNPADVRGVQH